MRLQAAISSIVRWHPSHHPARGSILQTEMHGDGTGDCVASGGSVEAGCVSMRGFSHVSRTLPAKGRGAQRVGQASPGRGLRLIRYVPASARLDQRQRPVNRKVEPAAPRLLDADLGPSFA